MLVDHPMTVTIPVSDLERARAWYRDNLGFNPVHEVPGEALAYRTGSGQSVLVFSSDEAGAVEHQLAAWRVDDVEAEVTELRERGVRFEEYDQPDLRTEDGIAVTPVGRAAWFKDSEGNVLTISQLS
jgi:catechol 2,3-dioxygenase-like lactoylglutathione lyase family enzyme